MLICMGKKMKRAIIFVKHNTLYWLYAGCEKSLPEGITS